MSPCPQGFILPLTSLVSAAWVATYAVVTEVALLALGLLWFRIRRVVWFGAAPPAVGVCVCALLALALALALWMERRNAQLCFAGDIHYTPAYGAQLRHINDVALWQAHVAIGVIAAVCVIGTALCAWTLVRGGQRSRRGQVSPFA
jgi:hypothetical protein